MHPLLEKLLQKRKIENLRDLQPEEKVTYQEWQRVLSETEEVTVANVVKFCKQQLQEIEGQMRNIDNTHRKIERLVLLHTVYTTLLRAVHTPHKEREALEQYLQGLLTET